MPDEGQTLATETAVGQGVHLGSGNVQTNYFFAPRTPLDPTAVQALSPWAAAARIRQLPHDEVVDFFAAAAPGNVVEILRVLLADDEALAVATLGDLNRRKATELIELLGGFPPWLPLLPEGAEAINYLATVQRRGPALGPLKHVSSAEGLQAFVKTFEKGSIYWYWDFGAVPDSTVLAISIYLSEAGVHEQVEAAVEDLLATADLRIEGMQDPVIGSWFREMWATTKRAASSPAAQEAVLTAAHVADTHLILAQDAQVTSTLMQNLGPVLQSLQPTKDAVLRLGALLIVKEEWVVQVFQLTAAQQAILDHRPQLTLSPHEIVVALQLPGQNQSVSGDEADRVLGAIEQGLDDAVDRADQ